jgi:PAS domain S-box-containing protein
MNLFHFFKREIVLKCKAEESASRGRRPMSTREDSLKFPWYLILIFLILSVGILTTGYLYYQNQAAYTKKQKQQELTAILDLKIEQIISWRRERLDYASTLMDDPFLAMRVKDFIGRGAKSDYGKYIVERLAASTSYQYQSLILTDPQGKVILSVPSSGKQEIIPYLKDLVIQAGRTHKTVFSDLYRDENSKVMLSVLTPLIVMQRNKKVTVGIVAMQLEPYQFLYPLIKSWPTPSRSGETELVRQEGDEVVFLNELRHRQNTPFNLSLPLSLPDLVAAEAVREKKGIVEGSDYRKVPVLGAVGHIPDSPWILIAKIDAEEIYAPLQKRVHEVAFLLISLIASAGIGVAYLWRNQQTGFYRRQYEAERERRALAQRYEYLTRFANDMILVTDQNLKIVEANDRAVDSYGYEREELLKMHLIDLYPSASKNVLYKLVQNVGKNSGMIFEAIQQRNDGTTFPVEISLCRLEIEGQKLFQEIIRDITQRKQVEKALHESEKSLRHLASQLLSAQEDERRRISSELHDELGQSLLILKLKLKNVEREMAKGAGPLTKECEEIYSFINKVVESVRRLSRNLSPSILEDLGLSVALRNQIREFTEHNSIRSNSELDQIDNLFPKESHINIYRIVQESLTNIGKYANATEIKVKIKKIDEKVSFLIEDNGQGFDVAQVLNSSRRGLGLRTMQERLRMLGSSLEIWSQKGVGTRISFVIPVESPGGAKTGEEFEARLIQSS